MKNLLSLTLLLISGNLFATTPDFTCVTAYPTTSVIVKKSGDRVNLDIIHHNGLKYAPIHSGLVTMNDLKILQKKGETLAKLGESFSVSFETDRCKNHQEFNYSCFNPEEQKIGDLDVKSFGFQTHHTKSFLYGATFKEFEFSFYVRTLDGQNIRMDMNYDLGSLDCSFN